VVRQAIFQVLSSFVFIFKNLNSMIQAMEMAFVGLAVYFFWFEFIASMIY